MDSEKGGLSSAERQRQTAAEIARKKVMAAYGSGRTAGSQAASPTVQPAVRHIPVNYKQAMTRVEQKAQQTGTMTATDWQKYHAAWQKYYQKYYSEYYAKAALAFVEKEKMRQERNASDRARNAENAVVVPVTVGAAEEPKQIVEDGLRARVRQIAAKQQKKRLNKKLIPIIAGAVLILVLLFMQYNRLIFAPIMAYVSPGNTEDTGISEVDPTVSVAVSNETKLLIPKLNIDVPLHLGIPNDEVMSAMNNGVAQFSVPGASAMPGEIGNLAISGHSAGDIYSSNQYKFIFSGLERLENGDLIYIDYQGTRYTYKMVDRKEVDPSDVNALVLNTNKPMLTLITCWPLGVSTYRLLIFAEQINPAPSGATQSATGLDEGDLGGTSSTSSSDASSEEVMPKNEPTFFERIWNWLTGKN
ncbi:sortase [Candidatus Saccharibacteria bacterium]|nr:sortase [Candidatus Saccharibacteria bacterium]